jgi:FAD/FMN-containing dehydrogenase
MSAMVLIEAWEELKRDRSAVGRVVRALAALVGNRLVTSQPVREQHANTLTWVANQPPDAVVFPQTTEEVQQIVRLCAAERVPVIAFGAGTSVEGQINAPHGGICVDFRDMNRVLAVHAEDLDCVVEPGITRKKLNESLRDRGVFFPIDPGADASLGGMAATRASGTNAVRYGTMKDNVLSLKVVLANGEVMSTARRAKKTASGYDLTRLIVGSEGTLGIITELTLRLAGVPEAISSGVCPFPSVEAACNATILIQSGIPVARIELLDALQVRASNLYSKLSLPETPMLFLEFHGSDTSVAEQSERFWRDRQRIRRRPIRLGHQGRGPFAALAGAARCSLGAARPAFEHAAARHRRLRADLAACRMPHGDAARHRREQAFGADCRPYGQRQLSRRHSSRHERCRGSRARACIPRTPNRARLGDGRHLHRGTRHRPRQDEIFTFRIRRTGARCHAGDQACARPAGHHESGQDFQLLDGAIRRVPAELHPVDIEQRTRIPIVQDACRRNGRFLRTLP